MVVAGWVDAVLVRDNLPELGADLVATLAGLKVNNFAHLDECTWLKITDSEHCLLPRLLLAVKTGS